MAELVAPDYKIQNMESEDFNITEDILNNFSETTFNQLPQKSRERYVNEKEKFLDWMKSKDLSSVTEEVVVSYFKVLMEKYAPSSLWATYSMLRSTLLLFEKVDISKFKTLCPILKNNSKGYQPKKAKTFELRHLEKFLNEAPDKVFLLMKVALVMGIMGACRCDELVYLKTTDIQDKGNVVIVNIHKTKNYKGRSFVLTDLEGRGFSCLDIYRRYATLRRLSSCGEGRFFLGYRNGKCSIQPVGVNMISKIPKLVANYLNLKDAHLYTGHCFRRTSAILFANSSADILILKQRGLDWSSTAAEESCVEETIVNKIRMARNVSDSEEGTSHKKVCAQSDKLDSNMDLNLTDQFLVNTLGINNAVFNNGGEKFYGELPKIENETDDSDSKIEVNDTYVTPEYVELNTNSNEMSMEETESNSLLGNPLRMNDKSTDEFQVFGDFVASELRNLRSRENQNKLKRMIQRAILEISEIDDNDVNF